MSSLAPYLDARGIIRVGGRLEAASLPFDARHQMLLPYPHEITKMLMTELHKENGHIGPQGLLSVTRQHFWPMKGKTVARSITQNCIICFKSKPKTLNQVMGNLPIDRIEPARPFLNSGVDFCGPFWVHFHTRGRKPQKSYLAVFCCFATKAVHLELVTDLTTEAFIGALKRFMGRRGRCRHLYCDNATNFVGAKNKLMELSYAVYTEKAQETIINACAAKGIEFRLIPPRSPHFGGLWEAAVKSAKHMLVKMVQSAKLSYEEMETVVIEIEAILNSRPITPLSSDPNDLSALTPGHFLIGEPLVSTIDPDTQQSKANLLTRWKLVTRIKQDFWNRWSREYLNTLQHRYKWKETSQNLQPGTLVLIREDNLPIMKWTLGRVMSVHKGNDGMVRVADIKTAGGILKRPITRLAPLPQEDEKELQQPNDNIPAENPSNSNDETPIKRKRGMSLLTALLLICLTLPAISASKANDTFQISNFDPNPGIYFENIGSMNLQTTEWKIISFYDLKPFWAELATLINGTKALEHLCSQINRTKISCSETINHFDHIIEEIQVDNQVFNTNHSRSKRGLMDIVGRGANWAFGILDADYAKKIEETIKSVKDNDDYLHNLIHNQTSIIDATINIMKENEQNLKSRFDNIDQQLTQVYNRLQIVHDEAQLNRLMELFNSISTQITLTVINIQRIQTMIVQVIIDGHHGKINPLLLSPQQLHTEILKIRTHLPQSLHLPAKQENIAEFYKLISVKARITSNFVIFELKLPILNADSFMLFHLMPIPMSKSYKLIEITNFPMVPNFNPERSKNGF